MTLYAAALLTPIIEGRANAVNEVVKAAAGEESTDEFVEVQELAAKHFRCANMRSWKKGLWLSPFLSRVLNALN